MSCSSSLTLLNKPPPHRNYTLSLHDALPISNHPPGSDRRRGPRQETEDGRLRAHARLRVLGRDRKSTRLNSSHRCNSYAVFCLKKKIGHEVTDALPGYFVSRLSGAVSGGLVL